MSNSDSYFLHLVHIRKIDIDPIAGIVYSSLSGHRKPVGSKNSAGYLHISAGPNRKTRHYILLHRLIWIVFHGQIPDEHEINHRNGNKIDNRLSNLETVTRSDNVRHARYELGKTFGVWSSKKRGTRLPPEKKQEVIDLFRSGITNQSEISRRTGIRRPTVNRIIHSL